MDQLRQTAADTLGPALELSRLGSKRLVSIVQMMKSGVCRRSSSRRCSPRQRRATPAVPPRSPSPSVLRPTLTPSGPASCCFVPALTDEELEAPAPRSKKELFFLLLERPVLLQDGLMAMWLDRETLAKCYMLSARKLFIASGDMPQHWSWIPLSDSRFSQGAQLIRVTWFEIQGQIHRTMLSPNSTYVAYLVFKPVGDYPLSTMFGILRASVRTEEANLFRDVLLDEHWPPRRWRGCDVAERPRLRADGWKEVELGQFYNAGGEDGEVSFGLMETNQRGVKARLILHGIEIRCLKSG